MMATTLERERAGFSGSYDPGDVTFLLKRVSLTPTDIATKELLIQSGRRHYSEMISTEQLPTSQYLALYQAALDRNAGRLADDVASLAAALDDRAAPGREIVIASLARAGTPIGILLVRALRRRERRSTHYSISIIRDRGIDRAALAHISARHDPGDVVFVDGWTGKGAIATELETSLAGRPAGFAPFLAVIADPAGRAALAATGEDYLIPSGLLNGVVSGLVSRSILTPELVGSDDFHACIDYRDHNLAAHDVSRAFVDRIDALAPGASVRPIGVSSADRLARSRRCEALVTSLMAALGVHDRNRIKPGIAEATRAVLRRTTHRVLLSDPDDPDVSHLAHLAAAGGIDIGAIPPGSPYRAVAVIGPLGAHRTGVIS